MRFIFNNLSEEGFIFKELGDGKNQRKKQVAFFFSLVNAGEG